MRRRLLLWSAPVVLLLLVLAAKAGSMTIAGDSAAAAFERGDVDTLRSDVATLRFLDPLNALVSSEAPAFADGALAVLEGRLSDAEDRFSDAAASRDCPAVVNLALVRETLGDQFVGTGDGPAALARYRAALGTVTDAPEGCFAGNDDPDAERRDVRADAANRLARKIALLERPLAPPPPVAPPPAATPPPGGAPDAAADAPEARRTLAPGDPLDQLRQLLTDGAGVRGGP